MFKESKTFKVGERVQALQDYHSVKKDSVYTVSSISSSGFSINLLENTEVGAVYRDRFKLYEPEEQIKELKKEVARLSGFPCLLKYFWYKGGISGQSMSFSYEPKDEVLYLIGEYSSSDLRSLASLLDSLQGKTNEELEEAAETSGIQIETSDKPPLFSK